MHYKDALWYGFEQIKKRPFLTTNLFISLMQIITDSRSGIRDVPGTTLTNPVLKQVIYTPPEGEPLIRDKLADLERFIHSEGDLDPLIKLALVHYQFEAIHPFFDGNGRTGRIVILLYLIQSRLLDIPALFLSSYIINHKSEYYARLRLVTENAEWENWILFMLDMVESTSIGARLQIAQIEIQMREMGLRIQEKLPKIFSKDLMEILFRLPYTKKTFLVKAGLGNLKTVGNYLNQLVDAGFLKSTQVGKEKLYLNSELMKILNFTNGFATHK